MTDKKAKLRKVNIVLINDLFNLYFNEFKPFDGIHQRFRRVEIVIWSLPILFTVANAILDIFYGLKTYIWFSMPPLLVLTFLLLLIADQYRKKQIEKIIGKKLSKRFFKLSYHDPQVLLFTLKQFKKVLIHEKVLYDKKKSELNEARINEIKSLIQKQITHTDSDTYIKFLPVAIIGIVWNPFLKRFIDQKESLYDAFVVTFFITISLIGIWVVFQQFGNSINSAIGSKSKKWKTLNSILDDLAHNEI